MNLNGRHTIDLYFSLRKAIRHGEWTNDISDEDLEALKAITGRIEKELEKYRTKLLKVIEK